MYGFRKPFTAATFAGGVRWGGDEKTILVTSQVLGYALAKVLGIKFVAELHPSRRVLAIVTMVALAEASLVLFGLSAPGLGPICLMANGLALGMVFGLVLGFLEGRRQTEALAAGLCASFILADGVTKSVGAWLLYQGVTDRWMPAMAGLIFVPPLLVSTWMLSRIPPPDSGDMAHRSVRAPMTAGDRRSFLRRYGAGLSGLVAMYLVVTILRSVRADFAPEIWQGLGQSVAPAVFTKSELLVALGVLLLNGLCVLIADNRAAFLTALGIAAGGLVLVLVSVGALRSGVLGGFAFMVLAGLGLYLPYVALHTTVFERLLAMTRDRGNVGFLMYVADSAGYLGYVAVMLGRGLFRADGGFLGFFTTFAGVGAVASLALLAHSGSWFADRKRLGIGPQDA
jgi:hypothetical protein